MAMMGSRKRPVFVIDVGEALVVRVGEIALERGRLDAGDGEHGQRERVAAERVAVRADQRAAFVIDAIDQRAQIARQLVVDGLARVEPGRFGLCLAGRAPAGRRALLHLLRGHARHEPDG